MEIAVSEVLPVTPVHLISHLPDWHVVHKHIAQHLAAIDQCSSQIEQGAAVPRHQSRMHVARLQRVHCRAAWGQK